MEHDTMEGCYEGGVHSIQVRWIQACLQLEYWFCSSASVSAGPETMKILQTGRCFAAVWIEPGGPSLRDDDKHVTKVEYNQYAYTKPSRFMSVRNQKRVLCCSANTHLRGSRWGEVHHSSSTPLPRTLHGRQLRSVALGYKISIDQS